MWERRQQREQLDTTSVAWEDRGGKGGPAGDLGLEKLLKVRRGDWYWERNCADGE